MAARDAQIHEDIIAREGGYKYKLCEGGRDFSGGQRQRLEIARVLAQDPTIVIMDEATSALDYESESIIQKNLKDICKDRTVLIIAHRLSTLAAADEIMVIDKGQLIEHGSHEELMKKDGLYSYLYNSQLRGDVE